MIVTLEDTSAARIAAQLVQLREDGGVSALGRVLTLIIMTEDSDFEDAINAANSASREHPCRVIVVDSQGGGQGVGLDAEIRVGGDAGASEVVVLHPRGPHRHPTDTLVSALLLPDAPIVVWWPCQVPDSTADNLIAQMASRRITDVSAGSDPIDSLNRLASNYSDGDTDLGWARTTLWRALLAAMLDENREATIEEVTVHGGGERPAVRLLAAWLAVQLDIPVIVAHNPDSKAIDSVSVATDQGTITLSRPTGSGVVTIESPDSQARHVAVPLRTIADCLMEDLRRLDADVTYASALQQGLERIEVRR